MSLANLIKFNKDNVTGMNSNTFSSQSMRGISTFVASGDFLSSFKAA